jgi:NAD(P)-dependent dehydrogenase (short-subunit alcohol dehydrogenase family)
MGRLDGKVAIITGGNSGIGAATVERFVEEGARVVLMARREEQGQAVEAKIRDGGGDATFVQCDVSDAASANAAVEQAVAVYGGVDILFNNAGFGGGESFPDESDDSWNAILGVNMTGTFNVSRATWPHLVSRGGGAIVNMSSVAAQRGFTRKMRDVAGTASMSYYAAKAGVDAMTRYMAGIGGEFNIRVNCVRPGQIITPGATGGTMQEHVFKKAFDEFQILEGPGYAVDVANTILFLASDEARFITAEIVNIDGGIAAKL